MIRWKLTVEYDGGSYVGWQRQENGRSIQQSMEEAVFHFCGEETRVHGAGRTDAGVHAMGQVAHVDIKKQASAHTIREALNAHMRNEQIVVTDAVQVMPNFHARISAVRRTYLYRILNRRPRPTLEAGRVWHVPLPLDTKAMHAAAQALVGRHNFTSFRAAMCQAKSPVRTIEELSVIRKGDEIQIHVRAQSFLHHQIRNFAGSLELVGSRKWTAADLLAALAAEDRSAAGPTAPPDGLYLVEVEYPNMDSSQAPE
ncbi:MAG: tRNA pseudouridine synthase A [Alphaproteobacteria bacterium MarineAlpha11_Bin1]|nr:MAG: tRNA pseudouridine synthase A [Alphaproteobacteria bacterium MarineAlpha11_Bin1]|tara:strand:+ start:6135 stop:6902 length:768 start_codon:yes stop_codon:yes gene_type:complete